MLAGSGDRLLIALLIATLAAICWLIYKNTRVLAASIDWGDLKISEDLKFVLNELIKKDRKVKKAKATRNVAVVILTISCLLFLDLFYWIALAPTGGKVLAILSVMMDNHVILFTLAIFISALVYSNNAKKKVDKEKDEYKAFRFEVVDRFSATAWRRNHESTIRDEISKRMHKAGINIFYKND